MRLTGWRGQPSRFDRTKSLFELEEIDLSGIGKNADRAIGEDDVGDAGPLKSADRCRPTCRFGLRDKVGQERAIAQRL